ncbi:MAG: Fe-S-containing protein [Ignavibacteria bacterium]|nr:Fe-S-containing protein [Ignavibacteria bacterium]
MSQCNACGNPLSGAPKYCPSCGSPVVSSGAQPTGEGKGKPATRKMGIVVISALLVFGLGFFAVYLIPSTHSVIAEQPVVAEPQAYGPETVQMTPVPVRETADDLIFSLEDLKRYRLISFEYNGGKTPRTVMAYVAPDGRLVTSISSSEHCGSTEFEIRDNQIHCSRCPSHWDIMTMEAYACCGPYYPDPIPSRVDGDNVHVSKRIIENWAGRL